MLAKTIPFSDWLMGIRKPRFSKKVKAYVDYNGYIMMYYPTHPRARKNGYVLAHYYLWERYHGACLLKWSRIYHKDKNKKNMKKRNLIAVISYCYPIKASTST
jgi:hypothetical protein